jgi:hypothetical protein
VFLPGDWFMSSKWFFLSTGQVAIGSWGNLLPVCAGGSELFFSPDGSCVALQLQLWLAPPPARWGNSVLSTALCPMRPAQGYITCPTLWVWFFTPPLSFAFVAFPTFVHWEFGTESSAPCPTVSVKLKFIVHAFQFCLPGGGGGWVQSSHRLCWIMFQRGWVGESLVVHGAHLFILQIHASILGASWCREMAYHLSQHRVGWEAFNGLGVQEVADFSDISMWFLESGSLGFWLSLHWFLKSSFEETPVSILCQNTCLFL